MIKKNVNILKEYILYVEVSYLVTPLWISFILTSVLMNPNSDSAALLKYSYYPFQCDITS